MKANKILSVLLTPLMIVVLTINCTNEDDAVTISMNDVSSRITSFGSDITGAGASLTVSGTQMDKVIRVAVGNLVVPAKTFTNVTEAGFTFTVPTAAGIGETDVLFVWLGSERGFSSIEVVALPVIFNFHPFTATTDEVVTIHGDNLSIVEGVKIGGVAATISSQTDEVLKFAVPAGITTGAITITSPAGTVNSTVQLIACSQDAGNPLCKPTLVLNGSLESGAGDEFSNWSKFNGGPRLLSTTNDSEVFRGSRALRAVVDPTAAGGSDQWRLQFASDLATLDIGGSYTVSARIKSSVAGTTMRFSTQPSALYQGNTAVGTDWTLIQWTFTANVASARMVMDLNGPTSTVYFIDDIRLIKN